MEIDCTTAVMLKILDGKCKMGSAEKLTMTELYDCLCTRPANFLGTEAHALIAEARLIEPGTMHEALRMQLYEMRLLAETMISRPQMKAFKAMLRSGGVLCSSA